MYIDLSEYEQFSKSNFHGEKLTVYVPRQITNAQFNNNSVVLTLRTIVCKKEKIAISALMYGRSLQFAHDYCEMSLRMDFIKGNIVRIRLYHGEGMPEKHYPMLLDEPKPTATVTMSECDECIDFSTDGMTVRVYKNPYRLEIYDANMRRVYQQYTDDLHNVCNDRRRGFKEGGKTPETALEKTFSFPGMERLPSGFALNEENKASCYAETVTIAPNERFYGLGERFGKLDKNGEELLNWTINPVGVSTAKSYKVVPFFISNHGYGVYYNTPRKIRFSMGSYYYKTYSCEVEDDLLDMFVILGDTPNAILSEYTLLTGRSTAPPKWAFGVWLGRNSYRSLQEIEEIVNRMRREKLPCDVVHIDWDYCSGDYDYVFDPLRFPDMSNNIQRLLAQGIRLSVWQYPYIRSTSPIYQEAFENGYLAKDEHGRYGDSHAGNIAVIDFSNPKAKAWYQEKLRGLLEEGVRVIKTDFGENAQDVYQYQNIDGRDMHNLYPFYYNQAAYEICQQVHPGDSLIWGRSAYAGCQRFPVFWGGDSDSDYSGMYHSLRGGLSIGLSGFPFWSHDVGGYFCTPEKNVYIRWMQMGMLSGLIRFHGTSEREPWAFDEETIRIYRKYAMLRYSLMEYIYSEALICTADGSPMMRALVLDYPHDPTVETIDSQYMFGRSLLVAPVFNDALAQRVYLPSGNRWLDYHTKQWYEGGHWICQQTPLEIIPLFIRGGTCLPIVPVQQYVNENPYTALTWEICPDDGRVEGFVKTDCFDLRIELTIIKDEATLFLRGTTQIPQTIHIHQKGIRRIMVNGSEISFDYHGDDMLTATITHK